MIRFRIKELVADKAFKERRKITMAEVSSATGVNRSSLSKMSNPEVAHSTTTAAIDSLCRYFNCRVEDVMEYVPDVDDSSNKG